jgi:hypothetical protein
MTVIDAYEPRTMVLEMVSDDNMEDVFTEWFERHKNTFVIDAKELSESYRVLVLLEVFNSDAFS